MLYQKPIMEILNFKTVDVICASVGETYEGNDGNISSVGGSWVQPTN